jgi:hypothetical protein
LAPWSLKFQVAKRKGRSKAAALRGPVGHAAALHEPAGADQPVGEPDVLQGIDFIKLSFGINVFG